MKKIKLSSVFQIAFIFRSQSIVVAYPKKTQSTDKGGEHIVPIFQLFLPQVALCFDFMKACN